MPNEDKVFSGHGTGRSENDVSTNKSGIVGHQPLDDRPSDDDDESSSGDSGLGRDEWLKIMSGESLDDLPDDDTSQDPVETPAAASGAPQEIVGWTTSSPGKGALRAVPGPQRRPQVTYGRMRVSGREQFFGGTDGHKGIPLRPSSLAGDRSDEEYAHMKRVARNRAARFGSDLSDEVLVQENDGADDTPEQAMYRYVKSPRALAKSREPSVKDVNNAVLRNFPKPVIEYLRSLFNCNQRVSSVDLVVAYIALHCDDDLGSVLRDCLTESQIDLLRKKRNVARPRLDARMDTFSKRLDSLQSLLQEVELMTGYMLYDRLGYRKSSMLPKNPRYIDFFEGDFVLKILIAAAVRSKRMSSDKNELIDRLLRQGVDLNKYLEEKH